MFQDITLEMSLKPFKRTDGEWIRKVCSTVFEQWRPLLKGRRTVSVMLWVADGSELLDYAGNADDPFEWCRFVGTANLPDRKPEEPRAGQRLLICSTCSRMRRLPPRFRSIRSMRQIICLWRRKSVR